MKESIARRVTAWPPRFDAMGHDELIQALRLEQRLYDQMADHDVVFRHAYLTVREDSTLAEKERYRDAIAKRRDLLDAATLWGDWCRTSGRYETPRFSWRLRKKRKAQRVRKRLEQIGDPTAPGWRPDQHARRHQWLAARGALPAPKPARRTVWVPLRPSKYWPDKESWIPVLATVSSNNTAVLPQVRTFAERWPFPPDSRVQCEWRERNGRPALHAVALAD